MSQTSERNTSRRVFLTRAAPAAAAFALAGGAAVNVVATGLAATPEVPAAEPDPIFAMIDRHQAAFNEHARAERVFQRFAAEDDGERGVVVGERPKMKFERIPTDSENEELIRYRPTGEMEPILAHTREQIADSAPEDMTDSERAAWIKMMERRLRATERRYKNSSRSLAYDVWNDAADVLDRLTEQMINTRPTTTAGVAAVLAYWSEIATEDEHSLDLFSTIHFLEQVAEATQALA
jgi:hypothetical protein